MRVQILQVSTNEYVEAWIADGITNRLPSMHDGWRFNFPRHAKSRGAKTYVLVTAETPEIIEGCLIYKMLDDNQPYMAFIEIAPHNLGKDRRYDLVAGCLIAFACRLSFLLGRGPYRGWLAFDVQEPTEADQLKLMAVYSRKYKAVRIPDTTSMLIKPEDGEQLIEHYLNA